MRLYIEEVNKLSEVLRVKVQNFSLNFNLLGRKNGMFGENIIIIIELKHIFIT